MGKNDANQMINFLAYEYTFLKDFYPKLKHYITNKKAPKGNNNKTPQ